MKGLIVIGYQGIGKSSIGGKYNCIDLESSNFYIDDKRDNDWYKIYCNIKTVDIKSMILNRKKLLN